jgi:predicted dehydrogenase
VTDVFDVNRDAAAAFARRFGIDRVHDVIEDLIDAVDVVDDCSPPKVHLSVALATLRAGKDYLVEKPMVLSADHLEQVLEAQRVSGSRICVIHNLKYSPGVQRAKEWVAEGRIGEVLSLERHFLTDPVTDRMLRTKNHWSHGLPGGRWVETLPHELYIIHDFLGALDIDCVQTLFLPDSPHPHTADELMVALSGASSIASFRFSARCRSNHRTLTLHGSEGSIRVELLASSAALYTPKIQKWVRGAGLDTLNALTTLGRMVPDRLAAVKSRARGQSPHSRLIGDYAHYLKGDGPAPVSLEEIAYVVRTGEEIGLRVEQRKPAERLSVG